MRLFAAGLFAVLPPLAGAEAPSASPDIVTLEKVIVEATQPHSRDLFAHRWLYAAIPDWEILSLTDSDVLLGAVRHLGSLTDIERQFIPARYLSPVTLPSTFVMFDHATNHAMDALVPGTIAVVGGPQFGPHDDRNATSTGGIDTADQDTHCVVQNRWGQNWPWAGGALGRGPVPTGLLFQLSRTTPALPLWYQFGFLGPCGLLRFSFLERGAVLACASWVDDPQTAAILKRWKTVTKPPVFPPISLLFNRRAPDVRDAATRWPSPEWMAEAALFLRWGLYGANAPRETGRPYTPPAEHRHAFETFVERSRSEVVTEALFRECFGYGYDEAQTRMQRFFIDAATQPIVVPYTALAPGSHDPVSSKFPNLELKLATDADIARILGDWERMQAYSVRDTQPEISALYLRQAGKTLHKSYDSGERDPRLLAVLGLYDLDIGNTGEARTFLQRATDAGVNRPAAYTGLAALNFEEAIAKTNAATRGLDEKQLTSILKLLYSARGWTTLAPDDYRLIARAWTRSAVKPDPANLLILREGMGFYPFNIPLHLASAACFAAWGYGTEAHAAIAHGLKTADDDQRKSLTDLERTFRPVVR